jgi:hypothetical protein
MTGGTFKGVRYIYADQDVAFKGTGKTFTSDSLFGSITSSTKSFNLQLKRGWNAVFLEGKVQGFGVKDAKLSLKDPADVRWTVDEVND